MPVRDRDPNFRPFRRPSPRKEPRSTLLFSILVPGQASSDVMAFRHGRPPRAARPSRPRAAVFRARGLLVRPETMRSSTSVSHACGLTPFSLALAFVPPSAAATTVTLTAEEAQHVHDAVTSAVAELWLRSRPIRRPVCLLWRRHPATLVVRAARSSAGSLRRGPNLCNSARAGGSRRRCARRLPTRQPSLSSPAPSPGPAHPWHPSPNPPAGTPGPNAS